MLIYRGVGGNRVDLVMGMLANDGELEDVENSVTNYLLDKGITKKYGLNYDGFISLLVDQVQKLKSRIEELENKLNERGI